MAQTSTRQESNVVSATKSFYQLYPQADTSLLAKVISDFNPGLCLKHCPNGKNSEKKSPEGDHSDDEWEFPDPKENEQRRHKMLSRLARLEAELAQLKCELDVGK